MKITLTDLVTIFKKDWWKMAITAVLVYFISNYFIFPGFIGRNIETSVKVTNIKNWLEPRFYKPDFDLRVRPDYRDNLVSDYQTYGKDFEVFWFFWKRETPDSEYIRFNTDFISFITKEFRESNKMTLGPSMIVPMRLSYMSLVKPVDRFLIESVFSLLFSISIFFFIGIWIKDGIYDLKD